MAEATAVLHAIRHAIALGISTNSLCFWFVSIYLICLKSEILTLSKQISKLSLSFQIYWMSLVF